jgi:amino acid permease
MIGVGSLTFAAVFQEASLLPAIFFTILTCIVEIFSGLQIVNNMIDTKKETFLGVSRYIFGNCWARTVEIIKSITTIFSSLAFSIASLDGISKALIKIFGYNIFINRIAVTIYIYIPLLYFVTRPKIEDLGILSTIGVILFFIPSILVMILMLIGYVEVEEREITIIDFKPSIFEAISSISLSFAMHYNIPRYFKEFGFNPETNPEIDHNESYIKMKKALIFANLVAIFWYLLIGGIGYYVFGDSVKGNILNSLNKKSGLLVNILSIILGISLSTAIPLVIFPAQDGFVNNIFVKKRNNNNQNNYLAISEVDNSVSNNYNTIIGNNNNQEDSNEDEDINESMSNLEDEEIIKVRKIISIIILTLVMILSNIIEDLKELLTLKGATLIVFFVYLLPSIDGIFYGIKNGRHFYELGIPILILSFGLLALVGGVYAWYLDYHPFDDEI